MGGVDSPYYLGVDLGTTYTAAAVWRDGRAEVATLGTRSREVPSVVLLRDNGDMLYGEAAELRAAVEPHRAAREFKRRLGDPTPMIIDKTPFAADSLMAKMLQWVVSTVSVAEGGPPAGVAVSHPANWGDYKRDLLRQALRVQSLDGAVLLSEPEAAAIHYASEERVAPGSVVAVYDLGGGTFDAALLRHTDPGWEIVGRPEGIERLGGIDFDEAVFNHVVAATGLTTDLDDDDSALRTAFHRLRRDCVASKEALSADTEISIPVLLPNLQNQVRLTRAELETMIRPTLQDTIEALGNTLRSADVAVEDIEAVLLVGGSSRIPLVAQLVGTELGRPVALDAHPKHGVALGAAIVAAEAGRRHGQTEEAATASPPPIPSGHLPATAGYAPPAPPGLGSGPGPVGRPRPGRTAVLATVATVAAVAALAALTLRPSSGAGSDDAADAASSRTPTSVETTTASSTTEAPATTTTSPRAATTTTPTTVPRHGGEPPLYEVPVPPTGMDPNESRHVIVSEGPRYDPATPGDVIRFQFIGRLADGTEFVNSWQTSGAIEFTLGSGDLISGFDQALQGLSPGDRAEVYIGSEAGYGTAGNRDGSVPPNSNMAYLVDVLSVS